MDSRWTLIAVCLLTVWVHDVFALPAFPNAVGFGSETVAGSGRHLAHPRTSIRRVTSLADSGPGTLRECLAATEPRTCIFEVGGEIKLKSELKIQSPYITVAGQTAPSPGILITRAGLRVESHDVLIRHISIRVGDDIPGIDPAIRDGLIVGSTKQATFNVVLDHLSVGWAIDENFSTWGPTTRDLTLSNSFIVEGLDNSIHPKGPHSKGVLIGDGTQRISLIRNLIANNIERNPYFKPGTSGELVNNLVYGWGPKGGWSLCNITDNVGSALPVHLLFIGNVYKPSPHSARLPALYGKMPAPSSRIFVKDNIGPSRPDPTLPEWKIASIPEFPFRSATPPIAGSNVKISGSDSVEHAVLHSSGARPWDRLEVDKNIIDQVTSNSGSIKDCVTGCPSSTNGWPILASSTRDLSIPKLPFEDDDRDGYTNFEEWLETFVS